MSEKTYDINELVEKAYEKAYEDFKISDDGGFSTLCFDEETVEFFVEYSVSDNYSFENKKIHKVVVLEKENVESLYRDQYIEAFPRFAHFVDYVDRDYLIEENHLKHKINEILESIEDRHRREDVMEFLSKDSQ